MRCLRASYFLITLVVAVGNFFIIMYVFQLDSDTNISGTASFLRNYRTKKSSESLPINSTTSSRQESIKRAMQFAWENYKEHSFGSDEHRPIDGAPFANAWGGLSCSLVDALDTLWIMGMNESFDDAKQFIKKNLDFRLENVTSLSVFETIIRELGGLLSAYDLSKDMLFLTKAIELADILARAYDPETLLFNTYLNMRTGKSKFAHWNHGRAVVADIASLQLEMRHLSRLSGDSKYAEMGDGFYELLKDHESFNQTGLFSVHWNPKTKHFDEHNSYISFGSMSDSFYEYLLKVWIHSGKKEPWLREKYDAAIEGLEKYLLEQSILDDALVFIQQVSVPLMQKSNKMEHLSCFVPGMLALGTLDHQDSAIVEKHLDLAKKLMNTCYQMYKQQPTGLSPDVISIPSMKIIDSHYRLRPETVESLFYLYRVTNDTKYKDWGWEIFQSIEKNCKVEHGYATHTDVGSVSGKKHLENRMESYFLAETLKYHFLLQGSKDYISLDKYVFNTEAHPFEIYMEIT